jgi:hypothetical protein
LTTEYWSVAIFLHNWASVTIFNANTFGPHQIVCSAGGGTGLIIEGDRATGTFIDLINVEASSFTSHVNGWLLNDFWQGVTSNQCNFNGQVGNCCITQSAGATTALVLLAINASQFNCNSGAQILLSSAVDNVTITGANNDVGLSMVGGAFLIFSNKIVANLSTLTGTIGVVYSGASA